MTPTQFFSGKTGTGPAETGGKGDGPSPPVPVMTVGIGASAGAHEPLEHFFTTIPADCDLAFVVVQHLPLEGPPLLADFLGNYTSMAVLTAEDGMALKPNTIQVIPPGKELTVSDGRLRLHDVPADTYPPQPIDRLFASLAGACGARAIAVVLSGLGRDGSEGVQRIKAAGGLVLVQEPATALNLSMLQNAIATGVVDMILPAEEIAAKIAEIARGACFLPPQACLTTTLDEELRTLFAILKARTGHDFSGYKKNTVLRRIERRMAINEAGGLKKYLAILEQTPQEAQALCRELLIGVTGFFRDPEAFEFLRREIIPRLFAGRDPEEPVRIWHACCATGEEAYSVAMLIREHLEQKDMQAKVQIFATDIDEAAVAQARAGLYGDDVAAEMGEERLTRFFTRNDGRWQVTKQLREMIVFAPHSLIKDPPFSRLDLLVCRNFLIYLDVEMQKRLISLFHMVLKPGGVLFLGTSENVGGNSEHFAALDKKWKIFKRLENNRREETFFPITSSVRKFARTAPAKYPAETGESAPAAVAERLLMERYSPPSLIVNEKYEVFHISTRTGRYLEVPVGEPTQDILRMAREELRPALRAAIYKAFTEQKPVLFRGVKLADEPPVNVLAEPLAADSIYGKLVLVILEPTLPPAAPPAAAGDEALPGDDSSKDMLIRQLEEQLRITHEQLQATSEQLETSSEGFLSANEELMSINEEFQSTNEELQSTNEELETSKEELQALNEELVTVNSELQGKMEELNQSNSDLENLFASSGIAVVFLDRDLTIKRFSPAMADLFNLIPVDVGRPFRHLANTIDWSSLPGDVANVLETLEPVEREVTAPETGRSFIMRILPYRTTDNRIDGIVVTLVDITRRKQVGEALKASEEQFRIMFERSSVGMVQADPTTGRFLRVNGAFCRLTGHSEAELLERTLFEITHPEDVEADRIRLAELTAGRIPSFRSEKRYVRPDRTVTWADVTVNLIHDVAGRPMRTMAVVQDITERRRAEEEREATVEFLRFINTSRNMKELIQAAATFFQHQSGCEAVGVRLQEGGDYPYFETRGFSQEFVRAETRLCARDRQGKPIRDSGGNPVLECMCGNVIQGRFDPSLPFFTANGSFWTNGTTELLASTSEADRQARTRNRCNGEGYESVALIPLRLGAERLGLLQLNDRRPGRFTPAAIALWERLADYLAVAVAKFRTDEALRRAKEEWERTFDSVPDLIAILDNQHRVRRVNLAMAARLGVHPRQCIGLHCYEVVHGAACPPGFCPHSQTIADGCEHTEEIHEEQLGGDFLVTTIPLFDEQGERLGSVHIAHDITERKRAEAELRRRAEELRASNEELERFNRAAVGRELRMIELKREINALCGKFGELERYPLEFEQE